MTRRTVRYCVIVALLLSSGLFAWSLLGQETRSGAADAQPAPRLPDGKPDLSGVWDKQITVNSAAGIDLPFTAYGRARFEAAKNEIDPQGLCVFPGVPRIMNLPYPFQIVQLPNRIIFLYEALHNFRIIHTDGRPHPEEYVPALMGHSVGQWEGDTLIIQTIGLTNRTRLDDFGNVHSEEMTVVERYWRPDHGTLAFNYTLTDPRVYTEPWTVPTRYIDLAPPGFELMEYACTDFNRVVDDGLLGPGGVPDR